MKTKIVGLIAVVMLMASAAWAGDTSALHPPAGSRIALVVFEDLQCPACARAEPLLEQAERNYKLPLVRHDFVIPAHTWSMEAHIMARYFDTQSLGEEFRKYIFANQNAIYKTNLRKWADDFAAAHHTALPAFYDPTGALRAKVEADTALGKATDVRQTPTIYVVSTSKQEPYVQVPEQGKLFETIEQVKSALGPAPAMKAAKKK
jgi:protein-disulfide isomerase